MNSKTKLETFTKVPNELISKGSHYEVTIYCYLEERRTFRGEINFSLNNAISWLNIKITVARIAHGYLTPASKVIIALLGLQEKGYISGLDADSIKGDKLITVTVNEKRFNPRLNYTILNASELESIRLSIEASKEGLVDIIPTYLLLKSKIHIRYSPIDNEPMAMFISYKSLTDLSQLTSKRLKAVLTILSSSGLIKVLVLPRRKIDDKLTTRPIFIALIQAYQYKNGKASLDASYDVDKELLSGVKKYEGDTKEKKGLISYLFQNAKVLGQDEILETDLV